MLIFFWPPPDFSKKILSLVLWRVFSPHTQENNSGESSWKYLEGAPLCFQVAFIYVHRTSCFKRYILERGPQIFSSVAHFIKQPEIKAIQVFYPTTPNKVLGHDRFLPVHWAGLFSRHKQVASLLSDKKWSWINRGIQFTASHQMLR